jgi:hypothetical protein
MTVVLMLWFSRGGFHFAISGHVSKFFTFVAFHFSSQRFKHVVTSSLYLTRPSWITLLCMNFKVDYVHVFISAIHIFMSKIITCIT